MIKSSKFFDNKVIRNNLTAEDQVYKNLEIVYDCSQITDTKLFNLLGRNIIGTVNNIEKHSVSIHLLFCKNLKITKGMCMCVCMLTSVNHFILVETLLTVFKFKGTFPLELIVLKHNIHYKCIY